MGESSPVERAVEVVVYAPLGVALYARDALPAIAGMLVARGRSEVERRRRDVTQQVTQARTIGRFAVRYGGPEVRRRVEGHVEKARATAEKTLETIAAPTNGNRAGSTPAPAPKRAEPKPAPREARPATASKAATNGDRVRDDTEAAETKARADAPPASALPIPDYDELSASQVVGRLEGLTARDLDTVQAYESAHRHRRTILGKIAQLRR